MRRSASLDAAARFGVAQVVLAAGAGVAGHRDGARVSQSRRRRRRARQERRAHRRPRRARLRLHRMRDRDAARAAGQSQAAALPPRSKPRRSSTASASTTAAWTGSSPTPTARAIAASSVSTSARTSTRRTSARSTTTSPACARCMRAPRTSRSTSRRPTPRACANCSTSDALAALLTALKAEQTALAQQHGKYTPIVDQDRARPRSGRHRGHRAAAWSSTGSTA